MQYDREIHLVYERLKNDKSVIQPWRNKAIARLQEAQAFIRMGQTSTNLDGSPQPNRVDASAPPPGTIINTAKPKCTCPNPTTVSSDCPVHFGVA